MINLHNVNDQPGRYTFTQLGNGVVIHCDPCGQLTPADRINGPHWAAVAGLTDTLAWVTWHELTTDHGDVRTPIADSIIPNHHHHFDGPLCTDPDDSPDSALHAVLIGQGSKATLWPYTEPATAHRVAGTLGGMVVVLPVVADYRKPDDTDPTGRVAGHRAKRGPCTVTHPKHGECLGFDGHKPRRHLGEFADEWDDDLNDLNVSRETFDVSRETSEAMANVAGVLGQALSGALGRPITLVNMNTGEETEYGPHSPVQTDDEPVTVERAGQLIDEVEAIVDAAFFGMKRPAEQNAGEQQSPFVCNCEPPAHARGISRCKGAPLVTDPHGFVAVAEHIPASEDPEPAETSDATS